MRTRAGTYLRYLVVFTLLGGLGIAASVYVLLHEGLSLPFQNVYTINVEFSAADGVVGGIGQPVTVVGVQVGQITAVRPDDGLALVTMQLQRSKVPHVYANADATLQPITPLDNMEVALDPGGPPATPLAADATIGVGQTSAPVPLSDLLSGLDSDTRGFLTSLIASLGEGLTGRGPDIRQVLTSLGPTTAQLGEITQVLAQRRTQLASFVHELALVTHAASQDGQLADVVIAGDQTLHALARQDSSLRAAIAQLPDTLQTARSTLVDLEPFAHQLAPTLNALLPAVRRLPTTLQSLKSFDAVATPVIENDVRPLVRDAQPFVRKAALAAASLNQATPDLTAVGKTLNYFLNELAYNPGGGDPGLLFWTAWAFHNAGVAADVGDANGSIGQADVTLNCEGVEQVAQLQGVLGDLGLCPK